MTNCDLLVVMLQALMLPVASKSSQDYGHRIKSAIIPRIPFGDAEKAIILAFGQKYGLKVDFVLARNGIQAADLVANGSVDIASAGIMTAYFAGKGRFMCKQTYEPFSIYLAVDYSPYACEITLQLVLPKRKYVRPYSNLFKPFPTNCLGCILSINLHSADCKIQSLIENETLQKMCNGRQDLQLLHS